MQQDIETAIGAGIYDQGYKADNGSGNNSRCYIFYTESGFFSGGEDRVSPTVQIPEIVLKSQERTYLDLAMIGIAAGILGARIYYVIFAWDYYKDDLLSIFNIRQGGLAIYGGIIGACIAVVIYSRKKKQNFSLLMDTASMSIVFGQIMGRWGNFFNREAFGDYTNNLFAMQLPVSAVRANEITQKMWDHVVTVNGVEYIQVHPTFLYIFSDVIDQESVLCPLIFMKNNLSGHILYSFSFFIS